MANVSFYVIPLYLWFMYESSVCTFLFWKMLLL